MECGSYYLEKYMKIHFVRHGKSEGNEKKLVQTRGELLTENGKEQIKHTAERIKTWPIEAVITSPFVRTVESADIITEELGLEYESNESFREMQYPREIQGKTRDGEAKAVMDQLLAHYEDPAFRYSDEETFEDFKARGLEALDFLSKRSEEHVLVVTHGTFIKLILGLSLVGEDLTAGQFRRLRGTLLTQNGGITTLEYRPAEAEWENDGWRFWSYSDYGHLPRTLV